MTSEPQVLAIANAFELVFSQRTPYSTLSDHARADESHFGQKASFWTTRYGAPSVVLSTKRPAELLLERLYGAGTRPTFVEPRRRSSAICLDVLEDKASLQSLCAMLDHRRPVFLAPYVHTRSFEALAEFLQRQGYRLVEYRAQAPLVELLCSKPYAQRNVFNVVELLRRHRPLSAMVDSAEQLCDALEGMRAEGIQRVAVKSASAVGGSGVYFVELADRTSDHALHRLLVSCGQNEADRRPPFIIEEYVSWDVSPTVDLEVLPTGQIDLVGIALQRLHDRRYYNGFYWSALLKDHWWHRTVEELACVVAGRLYDMGYVGPANIDFVVSSECDRVTLIEVNPRRSALIDGYGICRMRLDSAEGVSISTADYINVSRHFHTLESAMDLLVSHTKHGAELLATSNGGFSSKYRWVGLCALGQYPTDSEDLVTEVVTQIQDPDRDETGSTSKLTRRYCRVFGDEP